MDAVAIVKAGYRAIGFSLTARGRAAGSLFRYPASFARHVTAFLDNSGPAAVY